MNWFKRIWKASTEQVQSPSPFVEEITNNFTPRAQQVLALSRREADRFNHNFVGTEHLLLGLIALGQGVAVNVLERLGLDLQNVRKEIEKQVGTGPDQKMIGNIPYTPRVKKVLALAAKEAKALNHTYVGTEHILLGLLREGDGVAGQVLKNLDVDIEQTRQEILKELDPNFDPADKPVPDVADCKSPPSTSSSNCHVESIDTNERYDVYCSEKDQDIVVYPNVRFKGVKRLFAENAESFGDFIEMEQLDGQSVYVSVYSVVRFCKPGVVPDMKKMP